MVTRKCDACGEPTNGAFQRVKIKFVNVADVKGMVKTLNVEDLCYDCQNKISVMFGYYVDRFDGQLKEVIYGDD